MRALPPLPRLTALLTPLLLLGGEARATLVQIANATESAVYVRDCRSAAAKSAGSTTPDLCEMAPGGSNYANTMQEARYSTALGGLTSAITSGNALAIANGQASRASVDASAGLGQLVIKQGAFSAAPYARVSAWNTVLQSYSWDGSGSSTRSISGSLDFSYLSPVNFDTAATGASASIQASISVFSMTSSQIAVESTYIDGSNAFENFAYNVAGYRSEAYTFTQALTDSPVSFDLDFTLDADRTYFVEIQLGTWGRFGGYVDATHTFTASIDDIQGLSAASALDVPIVISDATTVAEPPGWMLLALGFGALWAQRRRRSS